MRTVMQMPALRGAWSDRARAGRVALSCILPLLLAACGGASGGSPFSASAADFGGQPTSQTQQSGGGFARLDPAGRQAAEQLTQSGRPGAGSYRIGPEDVIEVSVFRVPELTKVAQVSETGHINLPLLGERYVASRTAQDVEREITQLLGERYLHNPQVTVMVKEYNSQRVTIEGEVKKPGVYPLRSTTTLMQLIAHAGGFDTVADSSDVVIFRQQGAGRAAARFDFDQVRAGRMPDPQLAAGDIVVVNSSAAKSAFQNVLKVLPLAGVFVGLL